MNFSSIFVTFGPPALVNASLWSSRSHNNSTPRPRPPLPHLPFRPVDVLFSGREPGTVLLALMYVASFLTGLAGNVTALLALERRSKMKMLKMRNASSGTRRLLANLAACDTLVVFVCMPANLGHHMHRAWLFGEPLCRAVPFVQAVSVAASVLSLAALGLSRYCGVHNPLRALHAFTGARVGAVISAVWAVSSGLCLPLLFTNETHTLELPDGARSVTLCVERWSEARLRQGYNFLLFCALPHARGKRGACRSAWSTNGSGRPFEQWLGLTSSALNPLFYCFVGEFRRSARRLTASYRERMTSLFVKDRSS